MREGTASSRAVSRKRPATARLEAVPSRPTRDFTHNFWIGKQ